MLLNLDLFKDTSLFVSLSVFKNKVYMSNNEKSFYLVICLNTMSWNHWFLVFMFCFETYISSYWDHGVYCLTPPLTTFLHSYILRVSWIIRFRMILRGHIEQGRGCLFIWKCSPLLLSSIIKMACFQLLEESFESHNCAIRNLWYSNRYLTLV